MTNHPNRSKLVHKEELKAAYDQGAASKSPRENPYDAKKQRALCEAWMRGRFDKVTQR